MTDVRNRWASGAVAILAVAAAIFLMTAAISCGVKTPSGDIPTLSLEAAIDNPRRFDLGEIAESIEFIPLDDSDPRGLMSGAGRIAETKSGFYIAGDSRQPVKLFDRSGKFVATRGSVGRGPNEYLNVFAVLADYETDRVWVVSQSSLVAFDADNPADGFSAMGPEGKPGLSLGGVAFTPSHIRDNRLVGYMQALDIADDAESDVITDPQLKALAATLKEESNPVIVVAELKK